MSSLLPSKRRLLAVAALVAGGWWTFWAPLPQQSELESAFTQSDVEGREEQTTLLDQANSFRIWARRTLEQYIADSGGGGEKEKIWRPALRIGSMNIAGLSVEKYENANVSSLLNEFGRACDLIALQGLQPNQQEVLLEWSERLSRNGLRYDFVIGPIVGRGSEQQQFAFLYNTKKLEVDREHLYTIQDPKDALTFDPLVAWFRVKGIDPSRAFTFSLVNLSLSEPLMGKEQQLLQELIRGVQRDGRNEDDVILAGSIQCSVDALPIRKEGWVGVLANEPTDPRRTKSLDNLLLHPAATDEFTGKAETFDFLRAFNLSVEDALKISQHLPLWGEFSAVEGGFQ
ncbi:MAG: hypothetical protein RLY14_2349 [Planctomycetota bacterium]|jgi:hypothetical protein